MTFDGWEGFLAVKEAKNLWALYFDLDDDGLKAMPQSVGKRIMEIELTRREARKPREEESDVDDFL